MFSMTKIKLFCFSFSGGSATIYNKWRPFLSQYIELIPIELPGRGTRIDEPLNNSMNEVINDVFNKIRNNISDGRYALLGHSMGATIAYELAYKIRRERYPDPDHIFFSGIGAPNNECRNDDFLHLLTDEQLKKEIMNLGGTSNEVFDHPELLDILLPILRNDLKIVETYECNLESNVYENGITIFVGKEDKISAENIFMWKYNTKKLCSIYCFPGNHFFIFNCMKEMSNIISKTLINQPTSIID